MGLRRGVGNTDGAGPPPLSPHVGVNDTAARFSVLTGNTGEGKEKGGKGVEIR